MRWSSLSRYSPVLVGLVLAACGDGSVTQPLPQAALTALPRALSPAEQSVLTAANAFSFALWRQVDAAQRDSNAFLSPLSASFSLGMAMNGAAGETFAEMRAGLGFDTIPAAQIDSGYEHLIALLTSLDPSVTMQIANSIWYRNGFEFNQQFLNEDADYFSATVKGLDFDNVPASLAAINGWVDAQTHGKIPSIVKDISSDDVMFLINAIYFKGSWRQAFDPTLTQSGTFHGHGGGEGAHFMHRADYMPYLETATYQAVDLPYGDSAFTMTVVLPKPGTNVDSVASSFDAGSWAQLAAGLHSYKVELDLPRFTVTWSRALIPDLESLGMHAPFSADGADFTRMSPPGKNLYISRVLQKSYVNVDEEGTEAAAVTGTTVTAVCACSAPMRVDRPFFFVIRERLSGTVLFMGKIVDLP